MTKMEKIVNDYGDEARYIGLYLNGWVSRLTEQCNTFLLSELKVHKARHEVLSLYLYMQQMGNVCLSHTDFTITSSGQNQGQQ